MIGLILKGEMELKENLDIIFPWWFRKIVRKIVNKDYDLGLTKDKIKKLLNKEDPLVLDIGANNGRDSREFFLTFKNPTVYCFEPDLRAIRKFKNRLDYKNCKLFEVAISDRDGKANFFVSGEGDMAGGWDGSSSLKKPIEKNFEGITFKERRIVRTVKLDSWIKENKISKVIDFIWTDVQGAEKEVIKGGIKTLTNQTKYFYTEVGNDQGYEGAPKLNDILKLLPSFELVKDFGGDVLLKNKKFNNG
jgi:FkbM family methyltransferase